MEQDNLILKDNKELTPESLRQFPGCELYTDEQAMLIIATIRQLAEILYNLALPQQTPKVDDYSGNEVDIVLPDNMTITNLKIAA